MSLLKLVKERSTVRNFTDEDIPAHIIDDVLQAGIWASSVHGFQPWKFVLIRNSDYIKKISDMLLNKADKLEIGAGVILRSTAKTVLNSKLLIAVFNTGALTGWVRKFDESYKRYSQVAEISAISAAVQNMVLVADEHSLGSCWLSAPLFCGNEIKKLLEVEEDFVAMLSMGKPQRKAERTKRMSYAELVKII